MARTASRASVSVAFTLSVLVAACSSGGEVVAPSGAPSEATESSLTLDPFLGVHDVQQILATLATLELDDAALDALLLERSRDERGPLVHYGGIEVAVLEAWSAGFAGTYTGLEHSSARFRSTEMIERMRIERDAGRLVADVIDTTGQGVLEIEDLGLLVRGLDPIVPSSIDPRYVGPTSVAFSIQPAVIVWNTERHPQGSGLQTWDDALLPEHQGCAIADSTSFLVALVQDRGATAAEEWLEAFFANGGRVVRGNTALVTAIVSGEYPCAVAAMLSTVEEFQAKGAAIEWFAPEPTPFLEYRIGISATTERPFSSLLFLRWVLGPDAARALVAEDRHPTRDDVPVRSERSRDFSRPGTELSQRLQRVDSARERESAAVAFDLLDRVVLPNAGG